ncbi:MAG: glycosyltransferase family 39 protein [Planctomycetota bacterium]
MTVTVLLVALAARLTTLWLALGHADRLLEHLVLDSAQYVEAAARIRAGGGPSDGPYLLSPLYPYLLAIFPGLEPGSAPLALRVVQALMGSLTCVLVAFTAMRISSLRAGWIAGLCFATLGPAIHYDLRVLVAGPLAFCLMLALAIVPQGAQESEPENRRTLLRWLAVGAVLGVGAALRPTALFVVVALALVLLARRSRSGHVGRWRQVGALVAGTALIVAPFTVRNLVQSGESVLLSASGGFNFWVGNHSGAAGVFDAPPDYDFHRDPVGRELAERDAGRPLEYAAASAWWRARTLDEIVEAPVQWLGLMGRKLLLLGHSQEIPQLDADYARQRSRLWALRGPVDARWLAILALLTPLILVRTRDPAGLARAAPVLAASLAYAAAIVFFFVSGRHRAPLLPLLAVLAGVSVDSLAAAAVDARRRAGVLLPAALLILLGAGSFWLYHEGGPYALSATPPSGARHEGQALLAQGRAAEAVAVYRAALAEREDATMRVNLALALALAESPQAAAAELRRVLAAGPHARASFELANLLVGPLQGEEPAQRLAAWRAGEELYRAALEQSPRFAQAQFNLGVSLLNQYRFAEAVAALQGALGLGRADDDWRQEAERALEIALERQ